VSGIGLQRLVEEQLRHPAIAAPEGMRALASSCWEQVFAATGAAIAIASPATPMAANVYPSTWRGLMPSLARRRRARARFGVYAASRKVVNRKDAPGNGTD
jgi:hypothetical protein